MAETPAEAAKGAEYIFTCVGNDNDLREVTFGENGAFKNIQNGPKREIIGDESLEQEWTWIDRNYDEDE